MHPLRVRRGSQICVLHVVSPVKDRTLLRPNSLAERMMMESAVESAVGTSDFEGFGRCHLPDPTPFPLEPIVGLRAVIDKMGKSEL